jgi:hypothetical protein
MHCFTLEEENCGGIRFSVHVDEKIVFPLHCISLRKMDDILLDALPRKREIPFI